MSDEFDLSALKGALDRAAPRPEPGVRAAHLALARANFERLHGQGSGLATRPTPRRTGVWSGVRTMLSQLTGRGALTATTALVACGFLVLTPGGRDLLRAPGGLWGGDESGPVDSFAGGREAVETAESNVATSPEAAPVEDAPAAAIAAREAAPAVPAPQSVPTPPPVAVTEAAPPALDSATADAAAPPDTLAQGAPVAEGLALDERVPLAPMVPRADALEYAPAVPPAAGTLPDAELAPGRGGLYFGDTTFSPERHWDPGFAMAQDGLSEQDNEQVIRGNGVTFGFDADVSGIVRAAPSTEAFANAEANPLHVTAEDPVSTVSIDVDTVSYSIVRQSLMAGALPPREAVRVEEMVNYFDYDWPAPGPGEGPFRPTVSVLETPWNPDTRLVAVAIQGELPAVADRPPLDLVLLIDTSGSMDEPAKLPLLRQSLRLMVDGLRPEDQVAIVTYAGSAGLALPPTPASDRAAILGALDGLAAGGSTNGQGGLEQAYATVEAMMEPGDVGRVLLATDGDFNVGLADPGGLEDYIVERREGGAFLSVLGFGRGNLDDAAMQALAQAGNGQAAYIDTLAEAQKVLVDQLAGALFPIAQDVKVQVEWNPAEVAEWRLIGYETRALAREDFSNDRVDAGELGAGHTVTAFYEVTPVGSPGRLTEPLRYSVEAEAAAAPAVPGPVGELGFLRLRWKAPGGTTSELLETPIRADAGAGSEARWAATVAGWGQLLRGDTHLGTWGYSDLLALAAKSRGSDPYGLRSEAMGLMRLADSLSR